MRGRPPRERLRELTVAERSALESVARATSDRADRVTRATVLLAVADGASFTAAARSVGRHHGDTVARWVARFNKEGLAALTPRHGGGPPVQYAAIARARILTEYRRVPEREADGTATWSLSTLQRALRRAPDGLPAVSTATILTVLWEAGLSWQQQRSWCQTGMARRRRRDGTVETVHDPAAAQKRG